jgi:hypothetical protein
MVRIDDGDADVAVRDGVCALVCATRVRFERSRENEALLARLPARTLSMALPEPSKMRPSMSSATGERRMSPENSQTVCFASMPEVPSKTWTTARLPCTSSTCTSHKTP